MIEQLPLLSHGLAPLTLNQKVRVRTDDGEDYAGVIAQINIPGNRYAVYSEPWRGPIDKALPVYRREELEAV